GVALAGGDGGVGTADPVGDHRGQRGDDGTQTEAGAQARAHAQREGGVAAAVGGRGGGAVQATGLDEGPAGQEVPVELEGEPAPGWKPEGEKLVTKDAVTQRPRGNHREAAGGAAAAGATAGATAMAGGGGAGGGGRGTGASGAGGGAGRAPRSTSRATRRPART